MSVTTRNYKNGARWEVDVIFAWPDGSSFRARKLVKHAKTEKQAREWGEAFERATYAKGKPLPPAPAPILAPTLAEFVEPYTRAQLADGRKPATMKSHEKILRLYLVPAIGAVRLDAIDSDSLQAVKEKMTGQEPSSINTAIACLSSVLRVAMEKKVIRLQPKLKRLRPRKKRPQFYTDEDFGRLVDAARQVDGRIGGNHELLCVLAGDAGLRCGELLALEPRHLLADAVVVELNEYEGNVGTPKGGTVEHVPLSARAQDAAKRAQLDGVRVFRRVVEAGHCKVKTEKAVENSLRAMLRRCQREAGLAPTGRLHSLRHTLVTRLGAKGAPIRAIQAVARHKNLATTAAYLHLTDGATRRAVDLLG